MMGSKNCYASHNSITKVNNVTTINEIIKEAVVVNDMQAGALPGINGSPNYFIINVGDGSITGIL